MSEKQMCNLFWVYPRVQSEEIYANPSFTDPHLHTNRYNLIKGVEAMILYPSLLTPLVVTGDQTVFDVILLTKKKANGKDLFPEDVNRQLKISQNLDPYKKYSKDILPEYATAAQVKDFIDVKKIEHNDYMIEIKDKDIAVTGLAGIFNQTVFDRLTDKNFTELYRVTIKNFFTESWHVPDQNNQLVVRKDGKIETAEEQDKYIHDTLIRVNTETKLPDHGFHYGFKVESSDIKIGQKDPDNPIQAYHPIFYYPKLSYANLGFFADTHISSRHNYLSKSPARVIPYNDGDGVSEPIGNMLNITSSNVYEILDKMGKAPDIDMVLLGGDLVDYIRNCCIDPATEFKTAQDVRDFVNLDGDNYKQNYQPYVDYIAMYSIFVNFYNRFKKPIFCVVGNHDCYGEPYGIAPRVPFKKWKRANEGIPADHNLTTYEAILAFGPSYSEVKNKFNFDVDLLEWFFTVFTPFSDFTVKLPKQHLVGLTWGDSEDLLNFFQGQGLGHLPRTDNSISDLQLKVLDCAIDAHNTKKNKVILFTHFTFISYLVKFTRHNDRQGKVSYGFFSTPGDYDSGTFETNRKILYGDYLGDQRCIQLVLSGHSHRRGLYLITNNDSGLGLNSHIDTQFFDYHELADAQKKYPAAKEPAIIVSDSAGPIPRDNLNGEFCGWGSDVPSGTKVVFAGDGSMEKLETVPVKSYRAKPRFEVALDFMDLKMAGMGYSVITKFGKNIHKDDLIKKKNFEIELKMDFSCFKSNAEKIKLKDELFLYLN